MSLTDYGENWFLSQFKNSGTRYLALYTASPSEDGGGVEVVGGSYARRVIQFNEPSGGEIVNELPIQFPTATGNWGSISAFGICDAATGGNILWYGNLTDLNGVPTPKTVTSGDIFQVPISELLLSLD